MNGISDFQETIAAGETASIENTQSDPLSLSLLARNGSHVEFELLLGQVIGLTAGSDDIRILLHHGDPAGLLVIKPESAS